MESVISNEMDYKHYPSSHPQYKLKRYTQITGGQTMNMSVSGGESSIFEIPSGLAGCVNFAQSYIEFKVSIAATAAAYTNIISDTIGFFRSVYIETRSGLYLCEINDLGNYIKMVLPYELSEKEFRALPQHDVDVDGKGWGSIIHKTIITPNPFPYSIFGPNATNDTAYADGINHYFQSSGQGVAVVLNVRIPLSLIKNSLFAVDKTLAFNDVIRIRWIWNPYTKVAWTSTNANGITGSAALAVVPAISVLQMYIATESNLLNIQALQNQISTEGLKILIPYVRQDKMTSSGTSQNPSARYTAADGKRLMKVFYSIFNGTDTLGNMYENCLAGKTSANPSRITSFYASLDGNRLSDYNYDISKQEDYLSVRDKLVGSWQQNVFNYYNSWSYMLDFTGSLPVKDFSVDPVNMEDGISLDQPRKVDFYDTYSASSTDPHFIYSILQRNLIISPAGMAFEANF